jgi:hypothetical protein
MRTPAKNNLPRSKSFKAGGLNVDRRHLTTATRQPKHNHGPQVQWNHRERLALSHAFVLDAQAFCGLDSAALPGWFRLETREDSEPSVGLSFLSPSIQLFYFLELFEQSPQFETVPVPFDSPTLGPALLEVTGQNSAELLM